MLVKASLTFFFFYLSSVFVASRIFLSLHFINIDFCEVMLDCVERG